jgi:thioesterase domain-containing protein
MEETQADTSVDPGAHFFVELKTFGNADNPKMSDSMRHPKAASAAFIPYTPTATAAMTANGELQTRDLLERAEVSCATCCTSEDYTRLRPLRTSGARPPLFCFFPGEPGARDLSDSLPEDQPVYQFFYPNLDGASKFPPVEELAAAYLQVLRKIQVRGPYQLCGYSKAGLLAYETATLLLAKGESVSVLALFDTWHPRYRQNLSLRDTLRFRFMYVVDRTKKYLRDLALGGFDDFAARLRQAVIRRVKLFGWRATRAIFRRTNRPIPRSMQTSESTAVLKDYIPKPYPNRLLLIRTEDIFERKLTDQTFGWHICATAGVDIFFVLGDHGTLKDKPYVSSLANTLLPFLADYTISK